MIKNYEKYTGFILKSLIVLAVLLSIYILITWLLPFFAPFVFAIILALINEPFIGLLEKKARMPRHIAAALSLLLTLSIFGVIVAIVIIRIYNELLILQNNISVYINSTSEQLTEYFNRLTSYYNSLPDTVTRIINENIKSLTPALQKILQTTVTYLINSIKSIPRMGIFLVVTLLATYFISSDRRQIRNFIYKQLPDSWSKNFTGIKINTFTALLGYLKAALILISITFVETSIGLMILRQDYALLMGLLVAVSDIVPLLGTGLIMIPWISWTLITGNFGVAIGLAVVWVLGIIIRQILEPKIVGDQIGLHPLITLIVMYAGFELFGVPGMLLGLVSLIILKNLQSSGILRLWKD